MGSRSLDVDPSTTQTREATFLPLVDTGANNSGLTLRATPKKFIHVEGIVPASWSIDGTRATCESVRRAARCDSEPISADAQDS